MIHEIARLRELTFRTVEEGTGQAQDLDKYDVYYKHLVLWDDNDLEIVGSYRISEGHKIMATHGVEDFILTHCLIPIPISSHIFLPLLEKVGMR